MSTDNALPSLTRGARFSGRWHALGALTEQIRSFANWTEIWTAYRGGHPLPELHTRTGLTIIHAPEDVVLSTFQEVFRGRAYTAGFYQPRVGDRVVDVGANIGLFALFLQSTAPGIRVACFEPARPTYERLRQNLTRNHLDGNITSFRIALSNQDGTMRLAHHQRSVERTLTTPSDGDDAGEPVEARTLSNALIACGVHHVDLLKMDIEGAELDVIESTDAATWARIDRVALEYHGDVVPGCGDRIAAILRSHGFTAIELRPTAATKEQGILRAARRGLR